MNERVHKAVRHWAGAFPRHFAHLAAKDATSLLARLLLRRLHLHRAIHTAKLCDLPCVKQLKREH